MIQTLRDFFDTIPEQWAAIYWGLFYFLVVGGTVAFLIIWQLKNHQLPPRKRYSQLHIWTAAVFFFIGTAAVFFFVCYVVALSMFQGR